MEATLIQKLVNELQCPTCSVQMVPPLMQCPEGHHYCNKCISEQEYCQKCQLPMRSRRNYSLENLCFSNTLKCSFAPDGCSFTGTCIVVAEHEKSCEISQKRRRDSATLFGEAIRPIEDTKGQSLEEALFAVLECPVCLSVILPPVGECFNGHKLCSYCFERVKECPICRIPKTYVINFILGKILEMLVISCRNARGGCEIRGSAPSVLKHERSCNFVMKCCPLTVDGFCNWQGAVCHLVEHCKSTHSDRLTITRDSKCIFGKFESHLSHHNLIYIHGVLFRFGWYACDGVYRFSVNTFGYVGNENRYFYHIMIFHRTANYWMAIPEQLCADLDDGDIKCLNMHYVEMSQEQLMSFSKGGGGFSYIVQIIDRGM